jgi:hypothetical protein
MSNISYSSVGDYLLPDIILSNPPHELVEPITKYGAMRRSYLKDHHPITYNRLLLTERLFPHLREIQRNAHKRFDTIMADILVLNPPPEKAIDNLAWATHMTEVHQTAEKQMLGEVVYV